MTFWRFRDVLFLGSSHRWYLLRVGQASAGLHFRLNASHKSMTVFSNIPNIGTTTADNITTRTITTHRRQTRVG
jgi:hypothetical protein